MIYRCSSPYRLSPAQHFRTLPSARRGGQQATRYVLGRGLPPFSLRFPGLSVCLSVSLSLLSSLLLRNLSGANGGVLLLSFRRRSGNRAGTGSTGLRKMIVCAHHRRKRIPYSFQKWVKERPRALGKAAQPGAEVSYPLAGAADRAFGGGSEEGSRRKGWSEAPLWTEVVDGDSYFVLCIF